MKQREPKQQLTKRNDLVLINSYSVPLHFLHKILLTNTVHSFMALPRIVDILLVVLILIFVLCGLIIVTARNSVVVLAAAEHGLHLALDLVEVLGRLLLVIQDSCGQIAKS